MRVGIFYFEGIKKYKCMKTKNPEYLDISGKEIWNFGDDTSVNSAIYTGHFLLSESSDMGDYDRLGIYGMGKKVIHREF